MKSKQTGVLYERQVNWSPHHTSSFKSFPSNTRSGAVKPCRSCAKEGGWEDRNKAVSDTIKPWGQQREQTVGISTTAIDLFPVAVVAAAAEDRQG